MFFEPSGCNACGSSIEEQNGIEQLWDFPNVFPSPIKGQQLISFIYKIVMLGNFGPLGFNQYQTFGGSSASLPDNRLVTEMIAKRHEKTA